MEHGDHVRLIRDGVSGSGPRWLEIGAGSGAFTLALADLLGPAGKVVAVDRDGSALATLSSRLPPIAVETLVADFTRPLPLEPGSFDGLLAANALHFHPDPATVLADLRSLLLAGGRLVIVEYDTDQGNPYVPYPFSFLSLAPILSRAGFGPPRLVGRVPSRFLGAIYGAVSEPLEVPPVV